MLTRIDVDGDNPLSVPILGVSPKESILIRQVTGLNPPDVDLFIGDYSRDGGIYQGRRVGNRNPVFTIELNPNPALGETVSSLREKLYKTFLDPRVEADYLKIDLILDDNRVLYIVGYTEKLETDIFSSDQLLAQISMICPDPYIRDTEAVTLSNPGGWVTLPFDYPGTAETGFEVVIGIVSNTPTLVLATNTITDDPMDVNYYRGRMIINHAFVSGDLLTVNTVRGYRKMWLTPVGGGPIKSIISDLTPLSRWTELHSASNVMKVYGATPTDLPAAIQSLTYIPAYWGI